MPRHTDEEFAITDSLLNALAMQESRNNPMAVGDRGLSNPAYGAYQMRRPAFEDVRRLRPSVVPAGITDASQLLGQEMLQREMARAYLEILMQSYGMRGFDQTVGAYNAGAGSIRKGRYPTKYLEGVRGHMK